MDGWIYCYAHFIRHYVYILQNWIHRLIIVWVAGGRGARSSVDISHSLPADCTVFHKDCLRIVWERHNQGLLSHERSSAGTNLTTFGFWVSCIFMSCENVELWNREVEAVLGHFDSSSCSGQSNWETNRVIEPVGRSCNGALVHNFYYFQHEWVTCLCSGHWWILVQWWLEYKIWFVSCRSSRLWVVNFKKLIGCMHVIIVLIIYLPLLLFWDIEFLWVTLGKYYLTARG
jgi:hypothetical protein